MTILKDINQSLASMQQPQITTLESTSDATSILMTSLANQLCNLISIDMGWQAQNRVLEINIEENFEPVSEYCLDDIGDFSNVESLFIWDEGTQQKILQVSYDRYLYEKIRNVQSVYKTYCFSENKILFSQPYTGQTTLSFVYKTNGFVKSYDEETECTSYLTEFTSDTDEHVFDSYLVIQGLRWMWYDNKNLPNMDRERVKFYEMMDKYQNRDKANMLVDFTGDEPTNIQDEGVRYE